MNNTTMNRIGTTAGTLSPRRRSTLSQMTPERARQVFEHPVGYLESLGLTVEIVSDDRESWAPAA